MRAHAQAMNKYRGDEMSTEVVVDGMCGRKLWTVDASVASSCTDLVRDPHRPFFILLFFSLFF